MEYSKREGVLHQNRRPQVNSYQTLRPPAPSLLRTCPSLRPCLSTQSSSTPPSSIPAIVYSAVIYFALVYVQFVLFTSPSTTLPSFIAPPSSLLHPRVSSVPSSMPPSTRVLICTVSSSTAHHPSPSPLSAAVVFSASSTCKLSCHVVVSLLPSSAPPPLSDPRRCLPVYSVSSTIALRRLRPPASSTLQRDLPHRCHLPHYRRYLSSAASSMSTEVTAVQLAPVAALWAEAAYPAGSRIIFTHFAPYNGMPTGSAAVGDVIQGPFE
ncbi:hypothetical protein K440DRAFT_609838 [Wilcoxina mikolae CBS 423.85]|nr:hypothetical protein K440DRAFT_609838 [Wilcoxina mikolae CBS 423.85]